MYTGLSTTPDSYVLRHFDRVTLPIGNLLPVGNKSRCPCRRGVMATIFRSASRTRF